MDLDFLIKELEHQRDCLDSAISALNGASRKIRNTRKGKRKPLSAAARKRISIAQRRRWKALKAKAKA